ncbi:MAG: peptidase M14 [Desulfobacteraceae bacterium]|nr:peptidase M14 [Desulfobacteraceae bacterium]
MKNRIAYSFVFLFCLSTMLFAASSAYATIENTSDGFSINSNQDGNLSSLSSYEELVRKLIQIEKKSEGLVKLEVIGQTNYGKDIYMAKVGDPLNEPVMIITQQHGNEPLPTESALWLLEKLGAASNGVRSILDNLYVLMIIRVNPEGTKFFIRGNADFDVPVRNSSNCFDDEGNIIQEFLNQGRGVYSTSHVDSEGNLFYSYDINRYHWQDWAQSDQIQCNPDLSGRHFDPNLSPVPEAVAVVDAFKKYLPIWIADFHQQANYITEDGEDVTSSILWPNNINVEQHYIDLSKQLCVKMYDHMQHFSYSTVTLYPGGEFPGIARNAYGIAGAGSILVELKGHNEQKKNGMIIKHAYEQMRVILETTADGSLYDIDPARSEEIPPRGSPYDEQAVESSTVLHY